MEAKKPVNKRSRIEYDAAFRVEAVRRMTQDGQAAIRVAQAQAARPAGNEALEQENKQL